MKYKIQDWNLAQLINLFETDKLNLNPPYQRGDIWTSPAKKALIESVKLSYPFPSFFIHEKTDGTFDMVDGQQRTRAILGYHKGIFNDSKGEGIDKINKDFFYQQYRIQVCVIHDAQSQAIEDFYYRVNKYGIKLNRPEILKAQYSGTSFQVLVEDISESEEFSTIGLMTEGALKRSNDTDLVGELLTLQKYGITDKKIQVDRLYADDKFSVEDANALKQDFFIVWSHITRFNNIYALKKTRYKQRNDIYTLYSFLRENLDLPEDALDYYYKLLIIIDPDISPSNEKCYSLKEYADNCVSQSNSKKAREDRLDFLNKFLKNTDPDPLSKPESDETVNFIIMDIMLYYNMTSPDSLNQIYNSYFTLNLDILKEVTNRHFC